MEYTIKYNILIITVFILIISFLPKVNALIYKSNLFGKVIVLDAGHGGTDSGAISSTIIEKDMNLILVKELEDILISKGAIVYLTRNGDVDLSKSKINRKRSDLYNRAKYINDIKPDIFLSIHLNSSTNSLYNGIQVFYNSKNNYNKIIAADITNSIKKNINNTREIKKNNDYYMYKYIKKPGVLIEAGFISNKNDNYNLRQKSYRIKLLNSIVNGLDIYFKNN